MKVLVTGGAGFIGSHVCELLLRGGNDVVVLDDLNDFYDPDLKRQNLREIGNTGQVRFREGDICDESTVARLFEEEEPDTVIHLAARAGVRPSVINPLLYERVNVRGTLVLLEEGRKRGLSRLVFVSSSSVYGTTNRIPFREDDHPNLPISPYAATKLAAEKLCYTYHHLYGLPVICLRLFTVYGPRQRPDLAIRKFVAKIDKGESIPVYGDGSSGRDYTFVTDTARGIVSALDYEGSFEIVNLGNSHPVTLAEMIGTIESCLGKTAVIDRLPDQPGDVPITYADIGKANALLGFRPGTTFQDGIRQFVDWYRRLQTSILKEGEEP